MRFLGVGVFGDIIRVRSVYFVEEVFNNFVFIMRVRFCNEEILKFGKRERFSFVRGLRLYSFMSYVYRM